MSSNTSEQRVGIAIVGTGGMGSIHADCYARHEGFELIGFQNRTVEKAEVLAEKYGGHVFKTIDAVLDEDSIQAVNISTTQTIHTQQVVAAAEAGKHIFCEKPLALTTEELDEIERAASVSGKAFVVGHQLRYHPVINVVRENLNRLGPCYHLDLEWTLLIRDTGGRCWGSYREGGFLMELGAHVCDLARYLFGEVVDLSGYTLRINPERVTEDYSNVLLQFENGAVGSILVSANHRTERQGLIQGRALGRDGRIDFTAYPFSRDFNEATLTIDHGKELFIPDVTTVSLDIPERPCPHEDYEGFYDVYDQEADDFLNAIRTGSAPRCTLEDGRRAVEMVLATYHHQGLASDRKNFANPPSEYRSDADCHPLLKGIEEEG